MISAQNYKQLIAARDYIHYLSIHKQKYQINDSDIIPILFCLVQLTILYE